MKKALFASLVAVVLLLAAGVYVSAEEGHKGHGDHGQTAQKEAAPPKVFDAPQKEGTKATCPVMGGSFVINKDTQHSEYKGKHVYFCCPGCKPQFDKDPEKYLKDAAGAAAPAAK